MVTYQEFKNLDDKQKAEVLRELKEKYITNKEMGAAWGVSPLVVSNLYKKYVEGIRVGRRPKTEQEAVEPGETTEQESLPENEPPRSRRKRTGKSTENINQAIELPQKKENIPQLSDSEDMNKEFNLMIKSQMSGEAANKRFAAIAEMFLKDKKYEVILELKEI